MCNHETSVLLITFVRGTCAFLSRGAMWTSPQKAGSLRAGVMLHCSPLIYHQKAAILPPPFPSMFETTLFFWDRVDILTLSVYPLMGKGYTDFQRFCTYYCLCPPNDNKWAPWNCSVTVGSCTDLSPSVPWGGLLWSLETPLCLRQHWMQLRNWFFTSKSNWEVLV